MITFFLAKKEILFRFLLGSAAPVASKPMVWFATILGVAFFVVYVFTNWVPVVNGGIGTASDNAALGTLYDARGGRDRTAAAVGHNSFGRHDGPNFTRGRASHASGEAIKQGSKGTAVVRSAVWPLVERDKRRLTEMPMALPVNAVMAVQQELRRRGCYAGLIDGDWGPTSRFAAAMFFDASGADVPIDKADDVLLALSRQPAYRSCREAVDSRPGQTASPDVQYVAVEVDGAVVDGTTNKRETRQGPRIVGTNGAYIEPAFVEARRSVVDENTTQSRIQKSRAVSTYRKRRRERWKRRVYQGINLSGN